MGKQATKQAPSNERRHSATEETGLSLRREDSSELAVAAEQMAARADIESAIVIANRFPRDEAKAMNALIESCKRVSFADRVIYSFPRGNTLVEGPSVHLAREAARVFGNLRYGFAIVRDDDVSITLRARCWDCQTNVVVEQDAHFKKLIYRKSGGWIKPDERDLRELCNRHGAIAVRNCILQLVPDYFKSEAMDQARVTVKASLGKDVSEAVDGLKRGFTGVGVTEAHLVKFLGHPLSRITADELVDFRGILRSILDGEAKWEDFMQAKGEPADKKTEGPNVEQGGTIESLLGEAPAAEVQPAQPEHIDEQPAVQAEPEAVQPVEDPKASRWDNMIKSYKEMLDKTMSTARCESLAANIPADAPGDYSDVMLAMCQGRIDKIKAGKVTSQKDIGF